MKKICYALLMAVLIAVGVITPVMADDPSISLGQNGAPDQQTVVANCRAAQSLLSQIERADSVTRINHGQNYNDIVNLLFAMNARVNSNNIAAPKLADLVNSLQNELNNFRDDYNNYDDGLDKLTADNCVSDPTGFYADLTKQRTLMSQLNTSVTNINTLIASYRTELATVVTQNPNAQGGAK